ncbi:MAG: Ig-like domain-containing protein, partial [Candidatus Thermoplasmatota archaeon]
QLNVTDGIGRALKKESGFFTIDSKSPDVSYTTPEPDATNVDLYDDITIKFNETMNTSSTENAILIEPEIVILSKEWSEGNTKLRIRHGGFSQNQTYLCRLTTAAKDSSLPGNNLKSEYSWSFKTTPNITASIKYPEDGKCYTGEKDLEIRYIIGRGIATYNITIEFFDGSAWSVINSTTQHSDGEYTFNWTLPKLDLTNAKLKLTVRDSAMPTFNVREKLITFAIDSTPPKVIAYTGSEGLVLTTEELWVTFSEPVNKTSVEQSFKLTKSITGEEVEVSYQWHNDVTIIIVPKTALTPETNYTAQLNITAKDLSIPGNYLKEIFSWEFVAALGQGDFMVSITFTAPTPARKGDKVELKVHLSNTGKKAFNNSGEVRVWFYEIKDGTKIVLEVKTLGRLQQGESRIISYETSFEEARSYNFLVVVESTNPKDLFNNKDYEWSSSSITVAEQPPSPVVAYTLIALMVILVIVIGSWVVISEKKKLRKRE